MNRWKDADQIGGLAKIVAVGRPGQSFATDSLDESHPASGAEYVEGPMIDVSATLVRGFLSDELPIDEIVASEVAKYIEQRNLYR